MATGLRSNQGTLALRTSIQEFVPGFVASSWMDGWVYSTSTTAFTPYPQKASVIYRLCLASRCCLELRELLLYDVPERLKGQWSLHPAAVSASSAYLVSFVTGRWRKDEEERGERKEKEFEQTDDDKHRCVIDRTCK